MKRVRKKKYGINIVIAAVLIFCMLPVNGPAVVRASEQEAPSSAVATVTYNGTTNNYDSIIAAWNDAKNKYGAEITYIKALI